MLPRTYFIAKLESSESQFCNTEFKRYFIMPKNMLLQTYWSFYLSDQDVSTGQKKRGMLYQRKGDPELPYGRPHVLILFVSVAKEFLKVKAP